MDAVRWLAGCRGWLVDQPQHPMPSLVGWMAVGWPGCRGWLIVQLFAWLASSWPGCPAGHCPPGRWPVVRSCYLFSTETSEIKLTRTLLFLKMKADSKKRQYITIQYSKQQHFCFRYLFSSETSEMIHTGTLLFLENESVF